jgi:hypothetical protein
MLLQHFLHLKSFFHRKMSTIFPPQLLSSRHNFQVSASCLLQFLRICRLLCAVCFYEKIPAVLDWNFSHAVARYEHRSVAARFLGLRVRIFPGARMFVSCECCVLSGTDFCDGPIPRPGES